MPQHRGSRAPPGRDAAGPGTMRPSTVQTAAGCASPFGVVGLRTLVIVAPPPRHGPKRDGAPRHPGCWRSGPRRRPRTTTSHCNGKCARIRAMCMSSLPSPQGGGGAQDDPPPPAPLLVAERHPPPPAYTCRGHPLTTRLTARPAGAPAPPPPHDGQCGGLGTRSNPPLARGLRTPPPPIAEGSKARGQQVPPQANRANHQGLVPTPPPLGTSGPRSRPYREFSRVSGGHCLRVAHGGHPPSPCGTQPLPPPPPSPFGGGGAFSSLSPLSSSSAASSTAAAWPTCVRQRGVASQLVGLGTDLVFPLEGWRAGGLRIVEGSQVGSMGGRTQET